MKKALVVLLAFAFVAGAFADAPVANLDVAEFKGSATVTWGVDLDAESTGFKNETAASFKVNIADGGKAATSSDNAVWGEIAISTGGLSIEGGENKNGTASIDKAVLHLGPAYLGILADNTVYGAYDAPEAIGEFATLDNIGPQRVPGVVLGADFGVAKIDVDFRNAGFNLNDDDEIVQNEEDEDADDKTYDGPNGQYNDYYAVRAVLGLSVVENLDINLGFTYAFDEDINPLYLNKKGDSVSVGDKTQKGFGANATYKFALSDEFYLKPGVGYVNDLEEKEKGQLALGLLFGFGDANGGQPYFSDDEKVVFLEKDASGPGTNDEIALAYDGTANAGGVSVSTKLNLNDEGDDFFIPLAVGFNSGNLVEGLGVSAHLLVPSVKDFGDKYLFALGLDYAAKVGDGTITPRAGFRMAHVDFGAAVDSMEVTLGAEFAGLVDNTTFDVEWKSGDLKADTAEKGKVNASIKIAL